MGHSVLHVDTAKFYGGDWASFTWDGLQEWDTQFYTLIQLNFMEVIGLHSLGMD